MSKDLKEVLIAVAFILWFLSCIGVEDIGEYNGHYYEKQNAVIAGVAHYTVNPQTGETKFEYITTKEKP